jgi:hypothetical protein
MNIDCIIVPTTKKESPDISILFACWHLLNQGAKIANNLLITLPGANDPRTEDDIRRLIKLFRIDSLFSSIEITFLCISDDEDIYVKHGQAWPNKIPRLGLKSGPNLQFFHSLRLARSHKFSFLNETDVFPLRTDWLTQLSSTLRVGQDWVLGSNYRGDTILGLDIVNHINGAAVYATGLKEFQSFCDLYWEPGVEEMCKVQPDTAYDIWICRLQHEFSRSPSLWEETSIQFKKVFIDALARYSITDQIANLTLATDQSSVEDLISKNFSLVHGKHFQLQALANALRHAKMNCQAGLSTVQALAIVVRAKNAIQILSHFHDIICSSGEASRLKLLLERQQARASAMAREKTVTSYPIYTAISDKGPSTHAELERLSKEKPSSLIAFSPYKAGSTLLFTGLQLMSAPYFLGMDFISYYDDHFALTGSTNDNSMTQKLARLSSSGELFKSQTLYGGFRDCIPFTSEMGTSQHIDIFEAICRSSVPLHFVFLLRDPRDCLVSLYYSHKKSHIITTSDSYLVKARDDAHLLDIDQYTLGSIEDVKKNTSRMISLIEGCRHYKMSHTVFAYEHIYFNQYEMFEAISSSLGKDLTKDMWEELVRRSRQVSNTPLDHLPIIENEADHIRKGTPGSHKERLSPRVIEQCSEIFKQELSFLQTVNQSYQYL